MNEIIRAVLANQLFSSHLEFFFLNARTLSFFVIEPNPVIMPQYAIIIMRSISLNPKTL